MDAKLCSIYTLHFPCLIRFGISYTLISCLIGSSSIEFLSQETHLFPSYAALGLVHDLNPSASGGAERIEDSNIQNATEGQVQLTDAVPSSLNPDESPSSSIPKGYGKIVRDEAGNVLRVELGGDPDDAEAPPALEEPVVPPAAMSKWVSDLGGGPHPNSHIDVVQGEKLSFILFECSFPRNTPCSVCPILLS